MLGKIEGKRRNGHESEQTLGNSGGQRSLVCMTSMVSQTVGHDLATEQH